MIVPPNHASAPTAFPPLCLSTEGGWRSQFRFHLSRRELAEAQLSTLARYAAP